MPAAAGLEHFTYLIWTKRVRRPVPAEPTSDRAAGKAPAAVGDTGALEKG